MFHANYDAANPVNSTIDEITVPGTVSLDESFFFRSLTDGLLVFGSGAGYSIVGDSWVENLSAFRSSIEHQDHRVVLPLGQSVSF